MYKTEQNARIVYDHLVDIKLEKDLVLGKGGEKFIGGYKITEDGIVTTEICNALNNNSIIENLYIINSVEGIKRDAFKACKKLKMVYLGPNVKSIERGAFAECEDLGLILLPNSLENIEDGAFALKDDEYYYFIPARFVIVYDSGLDYDNYETIRNFDFGCADIFRSNNEVRISDDFESLSFCELYRVGEDMDDDQDVTLVGDIDD